MKYKTIKSKANLYFLSSVITGHKVIFTNAEVAQIPLNSLNWLRENKYCQLYAYCLMPNHIHAIVRTEMIEKMVARFHSFTAHEIIKYLKKHDEIDLLEVFEANAQSKKHDRQYLVWEDSLIRIIETKKVLFDLMEYVHNNPVSKKWRLVKSRGDYPYSSACYFDKGIGPIIPVDNFGELVVGLTE